MAIASVLSSVLTSYFKQGGPPSLNFGLDHFFTLSRVIPSLFRHKLGRFDKTDTVHNIILLGNFPPHKIVANAEQ